MSSRVQSYGSETVHGCVGEWQKFLAAEFKSSMTGTKAMINADHKGHTRPHTRPGNELTAVSQHFHRSRLTLCECPSVSLQLITAKATVSN